MATKLIRRFSYKRPASCIPEQKRIDLAAANKSWSYCCDPSNPIINGKYAPKKVRVSLIGVNNKAGQLAAYILQQQSSVDRVYMFGCEDVIDTAMDLNNIDKNCRVEGYYKDEDIGYSLRNTDIVMIMDVDKKEDKTEKKFTVSAPRVAKIAESCRIHCPRAMVVVCVDPVCCMVPLVRHKLEGSLWFNPRKLVGSVSYVQTRVNAIAARFLQLDPTFMQIPLVGGPDFESMVPAVSLMVPNPNFSARVEKKFYRYLKKQSTAVWDRFNARRSPINESVAIANLAITIARGLCGYTDAWSTAFASYYMWKKDRYMVSTIRFGEYGICYNNGIPNLSLFEMQQLVFALGKLRSRKKVLNSILRPQKPITDLSRIIG